MRFWFGVFSLSFLTLVGCGEVDRCLDSGGCWDKVDKVCRKSESNAQRLCNRGSSEFNSTPYLEDFEDLKNHISKSYANLQYLLKYHEINPYELNLTTISKIKSAKNDDEAISTVVSFAKRFRDGHFKLKKNESNDKEHRNQIAEPELKKSTPPDLACNSLGLSKKKEYDFLFLVERALVAKRGGGAFPFLVLRYGDKQVGIIRIASFQDSVYSDICKSAWEKYRKSISDRCNKDCREQFQYYFLRERIIDEFYASLETVQKHEIDALVVDLTNNGGGNEWVDQVTTILTEKKIVCGRNGFVKHPHHVNNFKEQLNELNSKPKKDVLRPRQLKKYIKIASETCELFPIWTQQNYTPNCSLVGYYEQGSCKYDNLDLRGMRKYKGKLFFLINGKTASAAEDIVARHLDTKSGIAVGTRTHGSGCGYINGGIRYRLPHSKLEVRVPDCVRERANGTNEVVGIEPNIVFDMTKIGDKGFLEKLLPLVSSNL